MGAKAYFYSLILLIAHKRMLSLKSEDKSKVRYYEYGNETLGTELCFVHEGMIPVFTPHSCINMKTVTDEHSNFTFIKAAYYNRISSVDVDYHPTTLEICFDVKFPFIETPVVVLGYKTTPTQIIDEINN